MQHTALTSQKLEKDRLETEETLHPFSHSLTDFCRLVEYCSQQAPDPGTIAALCEAQAEAVRITGEDVSVETVDLLLNTMLNTLNYLAEAQEQKRWKNRLKAAVVKSVTGRESQSAQHPSLVLQYS